MPDLTLVPVTSRAALKEFIYLPARVHAQRPNWMPPLYLDEWTYFNPRKNKSFSYCDTLLLLVKRGPTTVGRIMGIIHRPYNARTGEATVRFAHLECFPDEEAARALLHGVEEWGRSKGMTEMIGPFGFSDKDPEGLMIEGFDALPILVTATNQGYLPEYVERAGFEKKLDCLDFLIDLEKDIPESFPRIYERVQRNPAFRVLEFTSTRSLKPHIEAVFHLVNATYTDLYGFQPLDDREIRELAARYLPLLNPRFVKLVVTAEGKAAAFIVGIPNMTKGIQKAKGKLLPFGILHILSASRKSTQLDLMLGAIHPDYRSRGLDVLMGWKLILSARSAGIRTFETHLVLETNDRMLAEYARLGARLHKRFRIYRKEIR
ncbi:MAG: hypothetical protein IPN74_12945 [Haliscomenobacter sp.]|nr:hypothetical protein [Haliscomenobacter sp.]